MKTESRLFEIGQTRYWDYFGAEYKLLTIVNDLGREFCVVKSQKIQDECYVPQIIHANTWFSLPITQL